MRLLQNTIGMNDMYKLHSCERGRKEPLQPELMIIRQTGKGPRNEQFRPIGV